MKVNEDSTLRFGECFDISFCPSVFVYKYRAEKSTHYRLQQANYLNQISQHAGGFTVTGSDSKHKLIKMHVC